MMQRERRKAMMTYVDVVVVTSLTNNCLGREMGKGERLSSSSSDKLTIFLPYTFFGRLQFGHLAFLGPPR